MKNNIEKINDLLKKIEDLTDSASLNKSDNLIIEKLTEENKLLKEDYKKLKDTSQEVINELNNSIEIIEDYFKKYNANN